MEEKVRMCSVSLFDSINCYEEDKYLSCCLHSLNMAINLELSHLNVLSKVDLMK
jgi:hypothetical protein